MSKPLHFNKKPCPSHPHLLGASYAREPAGAGFYVSWLGRDLFPVYGRGDVQTGEKKGCVQQRSILIGYCSMERKTDTELIIMATSA